MSRSSTLGAMDGNALNRTLIRPIPMVAQTALLSEMLTSSPLIAHQPDLSFLPSPNTTPP